MDRLLSFLDLWNLAIERNKYGNGLFYHPCCDIWTTRNSKTNRASHKLHINWKQLMASFPRETLDKKQALQAKMVEKGWRIPVLVNQPCKTRAVGYPPLLPFKPHFPQAQTPFPLACSEIDGKTSHSHLGNNDHNSIPP